MVKVMNFNESLEGDIKRLSVEIKEAQRSPEAASMPEREMVKQSIRAFDRPPASAPNSGSQSTAPDPSDSVLPSYLASSTTDPQVKREIERLIGLVFRENLTKALAEVRKHPAFVQDAFHDALVDKLLPELKKRGIVT